MPAVVVVAEEVEVVKVAAASGSEEKGSSFEDWRNCMEIGEREEEESCLRRRRAAASLKSTAAVVAVGDVAEVWIEAG